MQLLCTLGHKLSQPSLSFISSQSSSAPSELQAAGALIDMGHI